MEDQEVEQVAKAIEKFAVDNGAYVVPREQVLGFLRWMIGLGQLSEEERKKQIDALFGALE